MHKESFLATKIGTSVAGGGVAMSGMRAAWGMGLASVLFLVKTEENTYYLSSINSLILYVYLKQFLRSHFLLHRIELCRYLDLQSAAF